MGGDAPVLSVGDRVVFSDWSFFGDVVAVGTGASGQTATIAFAEDSVAKTRDAYSKMSAAAKEGAQAAEEIMQAAQAGAKSFGDKVLHRLR